MPDLNSRAAECMGWVTEVQGNGWVMWQEARDAKIKILKSGFFSSGGAKYDVWNPKKNIAQAWLLVEKCIEMQLEVHISYAGIFHCTVADVDGNIENWRDRKIFTASDITAPKAITAACVEALSKCPK